ncbi:MAG TPA: MFS transporter [Steroidobacteraceae bacterium]|nr:MFS transporter [Steroidobacteraceae bacterium]
MNGEMNQAPSAGLAKLLTCFMFFTFAMTTDAVGSVIPRVIEEYRLSMTAASAFQYATMLGIATGALLLGFLADRFGRQRTIILGLSLYGISSLLVAIGGHFPALVAMLALSGLGISVFKTAALALIGDITSTPKAHTRFMNNVEGWFAVGAITGPAIVAALLTGGVSWKWLYVVAAAICFALVLMAARVPNLAPRTAIERASFTQMLAIARDPIAMGFSLLVALYVAVEVAIYTWMPTYLKGYAGAHVWWPAWALTAFFVLRAAGRFLGAWMLERVRWTVALAVMGALIFLCFSGALLGGLEAGVWLLPLTGLFMSIVYPTLNSKAISCFPKHQHGAAAGVILFFTALAAAAGPFAMGAVSDAWQTPRAGFVLATVFSALLLAGLLANWLRDPSRNRLEGASLGNSPG